MQAKNYTAKRLREDIAKTDKTKLEVPLEYKKTGRESVAALIETSLEAMPEAAKNVFLAWGAFWSAQISPELMNYYVGMASRLSETEESLNLLHRYGFANLNHATSYEDGRPRSIATYRLQDLAFSYSEKRANQEMREKALAACLSYVIAHKSSSLDNFAALIPEIDNFLGASHFAMQNKFYTEVEEFAWGLYADNQVLAYQALYSIAISFLEQAVQAAEKLDNKYTQSAHLGNMGLAYGNLRRNEQAIEIFQQALALGLEISNKTIEANSLGGLGTVYSDLGQYEQASDYLEQALRIHGEIGDKQGQGNQLCNLGIAYRHLGKYEKAIDCHQQALALGLEIGNKSIEAHNIGGLGIVYSSMGEYEQAIDYHQRFLVISREIGDRPSEGGAANNLGVSYAKIGNYQQAIHYFDQALVIWRELGVPHLIEQAENNLARVRQALVEQGGEKED